MNYTNDFINSLEPADIQRHYNVYVFAKDIKTLEIIKTLNFTPYKIVFNKIFRFIRENWYKHLIVSLLHESDALFPVVGVRTVVKAKISAVNFLRIFTQSFYQFSLNQCKICFIFMTSLTANKKIKSTFSVSECYFWWTNSSSDGKPYVDRRFWWESKFDGENWEMSWPQVRDNICICDLCNCIAQFYFRQNHRHALSTYGRWVLFQRKLLLVY